MIKLRSNAAPSPIIAPDHGVIGPFAFSAAADALTAITYFFRYKMRVCSVLKIFWFQCARHLYIRASVQTTIRL